MGMFVHAGAGRFGSIVKCEWNFRSTFHQWKLNGLIDGSYIADSLLEKFSVLRVLGSLWCSEFFQELKEAPY